MHLLIQTLMVSHMKMKILSIVNRIREAETLHELIGMLAFACVVNVVFFVTIKIALKLLAIPITTDVLRVLGYVLGGGCLLIYVGRFRIMKREDWLINLLLRGRKGAPQYNRVKNDFRKYRKGGYAYQKMCNYLEHCKGCTLELNSEQYKEYKEQIKKIAVDEEKRKSRLRTAVCLVLPGTLGYAYLTTGEWRWIWAVSFVIVLAWVVRTILDLVEEFRW